MKIIIFLIWLIGIIIWNYGFPNASPFDDVFISSCFYFFNRSLGQHLYE